MVEFQKNALYARLVADCVCLVDYNGLSDSDWQLLVEFIQDQSKPFEEIKILVYSIGGKPSTKQRGMFEDMSVNKMVTVGALTDVLLVRGAVMAFGWVGKINIKAFDPQKLKAALTYLRVDLQHLEAVRECLSEMDTSLNARNST